MDSTNGFDFFVRFLRILVAKKKTIFFATLIPTVITIIFVLVVDSKYKSEALLNPPKQDQPSPLSAIQDAAGGMGGLFGSLLGQESGFGDCISILESARFARLIIERYDLETDYGFKRPGKEPSKYYYANVIKEFRRHAQFEDTEEGAIKISMIDTSAVRAQEMLSYMIHVLDSLYTDVQKNAITQKLGYIDQRLAAAEAEMKRLEDSLVSFQNRNNLLAPGAQMGMILQNATQTELRLETTKEDMALEAALRGTSSSRYQDLSVQRRLLEKNLSDKIRSKSDSNSLILSTHKLPALATEYFRLERAYSVRLGVYKFLVQQAEMLKLDAGKDIRVVSVVDPPWVNDKRVSPKRRVMVQAVFVIFLLGSIFFVVLNAAWVRHKEEHPESGRMARELRRDLLRF